jgi:CheY-like chemotaxis protein
VSRITRNKLQLRKEIVDLAMVVRNAVETSRPLIEKAGHELTVTLPVEPIHVEADESRLAQVFSNLLNNAAKYTEQGGRIWLTVETARGGMQSPDEVIIRVKDTGVGIPPDQLPHIFDMFTQVDHSLERSQGGLGIGLTLVKSLTEMHGGTVEVLSEGRGKGSEFVVRLPIVSESPAQQQSPAEDECNAAAGPCKVLIVDDSEDTATSMRTILLMMGHDVRIARDGMEAVETAGSYQPHIVLLDLSLPKMNGYEVARHIREQPWGKDMKLVALTGWGQDQDKQRSKEAGFDLHVTKPVEPAALEELLRELCTPPG